MTGLMPPRHCRIEPHTRPHGVCSLTRGPVVACWDEKGVGWVFNPGWAGLYPAR